jgi:hypothetical protein
VFFNKISKLLEICCLGDKGKGTLKVLPRDLTFFTLTTGLVFKTAKVRTLEGDKPCNLILRRTFLTSLSDKLLLPFLIHLWENIFNKEEKDI